MKFNDFFSLIVSKYKHENFLFDRRISVLFILKFLLFKLLCMFYGKLRFPFSPRCFIHLSSIVDYSKKLSFGSNFNLSEHCYINALSEDGIRLGYNVSIGKCTNVECTGSLLHLGKGLKIGNNVGLGTHGFWGCAGGIEVGNDVIFGNYVSLHSENHNFQNLTVPIRLQGVNNKGIKIGNNCWIGAKVTILDGAIVGDGCVIAAGAVVKGYFPDNCIIGGVPAKILKYR